MSGAPWHCMARVGRKDDLRLDLDWPDHPKTQKLIRRLGPCAPLALLRLWRWAARNRQTGDLTGLPNEDIAIASGLYSAPFKAPGAVSDTDAETWTTALRELRWIDGQDGAYQLHDWAQHQPWIAAAPERKRWSDEMNERKKQGGRRRKSRRSKRVTDTDTDTDTASETDTDADAHSDAGPASVSTTTLTTTRSTTPAQRGVVRSVLCNGSAADVPRSASAASPQNGKVEARPLCERLNCSAAALYGPGTINAARHLTERLCDEHFRLRVYGQKVKP